MHPFVTETLLLTRAGVPWDVVMDMDPAEKLGWGIRVQELETGKSFNWAAMRWPDA